MTSISKLLQDMQNNVDFTTGEAKKFITNGPAETWCAEDHERGVMAAPRIVMLGVKRRDTGESILTLLTPSQAQQLANALASAAETSVMQMIASYYEGDET